MLKVIDARKDGIEVQEVFGGHRWRFPVLILDDSRRCLAHAGMEWGRASSEAATVRDAYALARAEALRRHLIT